MITITLLSLIGPFMGIVFMANSLSFAMIYYWGRKSKNTIVNVAGLFNLRAPYLPWFYLMLSMLWEIEMKQDLVGILVGHFYFYFKEIHPRIKKSGGFSLLKTPNFIYYICDKLNLNSEIIFAENENDLIF